MEQSGEALPVYGYKSIEIPLSYKDASVFLIGYSRKNKILGSAENFHLRLWSCKSIFSINSRKKFRCFLGSIMNCQHRTQNDFFLFNKFSALFSVQ